MSDLAPRHHRMLELDRLTLDLTLHILELVPHLQIPAPEQKVTATRKPSVVDTRRCCSHQHLFALLLLLLLHLRANQEPPGRKFFVWSKAATHRYMRVQRPVSFFFCEWAALSSAVASPESS